MCTVHSVVCEPDSCIVEQWDHRAVTSDGLLVCFPPAWTCSNNVILLPPNLFISTVSPNKPGNIVFWKLGGEGGDKRARVGGARLRRRDERKQAVDTDWRKWEKKKWGSGWRKTVGSISEVWNSDLVDKGVQNIPWDCRLSEMVQLTLLLISVGNQKSIYYIH